MTAIPAASLPPLREIVDSAEGDVDLANRIGQGDGRAFEALMRRHNRMLFRLARSILRNDMDAEDALQNAYLAAFRAIGSFKGGARISTWLGRIVVNECYSRLRREKRSATVFPLTDADHDPLRNEDIAMADPKAELPEAAALRGELRRILERGIDALPEQFRTVFMLRDVEEMSVEETAACLGIPAPTVRTRAFRARHLLRESLARELDIVTLDAFGFAGERCDRIVATVLDRLRDAHLFFASATAPVSPPFPGDKT